jgi:hypothetical protein
MKDKLFNELVASVREGGAILRNEMPPSRKFVIEGQTYNAYVCTMNYHKVSLLRFWE